MPEVIHDCLECNEQPMVSFNISQRFWSIQCFCYARPEVRGETFRKALREWNKQNEPADLHPPKRFYEDITGEPV